MSHTGQWVLVMGQTGQYRTRSCVKLVIKLRVIGQTGQYVKGTSWNKWVDESEWVNMCY